MPNDEYERGWRDSYRENEKWVLVLDRYQRDNLLAALNLIGYPSGGVAPFTLLNTGDWLGEIVLQLASQGTEAAFQMNAEKTGVPLPTMTRAEVVERVRLWLDQMIRELGP